MASFPAPIIHPSRCPTPVLLSVAHSGRDYPADIVALSTQGVACLQPLEDPLVDRLAWRAIRAGIGAVIQPVPRAVIDCNRGEEETDPASIIGVSPQPVGDKARFGLGIVPSRTRRHGKLWRRPIDRMEFEERLNSIHRPFHDAVHRGLAEQMGREGAALLLDLHSMPPRPSGNAQIVIGDRHGRTSAPWLVELACTMAREAGYSVARNDPYAGGAIVALHGRPRQGIHALQVEMDRRLYLDVTLRHPGPGFDRLACFLEQFAMRLGEAVGDDRLPRAAE